MDGLSCSGACFELIIIIRLKDEPSKTNRRCAELREESLYTICEQEREFFKKARPSDCAGLLVLKFKTMRWRSAKRLERTTRTLDGEDGRAGSKLK